MSARFHCSATLFLLSLCAAACSGSPVQQAEKDVARLHSWTAAARMTVDSWAARRVPGSYASRTLEIAQQEMQTAARSLQKHASTPTASPVGSSALSAARAATAHLATARAQVERGGRAGAAGSARSLAADAAALAAADSALEAASR